MQKVNEREVSKVVDFEVIDVEEKLDFSASCTNDCTTQVNCGSHTSCVGVTIGWDL